MNSLLSRWSVIQPWLTVAVRLGLAAVWIIAGGNKVGDLDASARAVHAYDLMPFAAAQILGAVLPFLEIALGLLLIVGLATRLVGGVSAVVLVLFVGGIISAWARGLAIDCGCFGGGGALATGQEPEYLGRLLEDTGFLAMAAFLIVFPRGWLALDNWLSDDPQLPRRRVASTETETEESAR
ncbi:DoxX family protein [Pilimelia columellifera]|uniref:DoxX family membrane protein n=1 Tax=Pilimelia columellifera subsp. columellifera TaxID=706583 RepID=A0ABN3NN61_9ACTN